MTDGSEGIAVESREFSNFKPEILLRPNSDWGVLYVVGKPLTRATKPSRWLKSNQPETFPENKRNFSSFWVFLGGFLTLISPPTPRIDARNLYRIEGYWVVNKLGQVSWPEVAGIGRNRRSKPTATVTRVCTVTRCEQWFWENISYFC